MSNTRLIAEAKTKSLPHLPVLSVGKHRRVVTKHFTNLSLWLPGNELQLLSYLIYDTDTLADNTFVYSTGLLNRFIAASKAARELYWPEEKTPRPVGSVFYCRRLLANLIEKGVVLQTGTKNKLMINPMLTYNSDVVNNKKYKEVQELYQLSGINHISDMTKHFSKLVSDFLESKKKNYKYGKR